MSTLVAASRRLPVGRILRLEDLAIVAVNVLVVPAVVVTTGGSGAESRGPSALIGLVELIAVLGAIAALATRPPGRRAFEVDGFHGWLFAGPMILGVALIGTNASEQLGLDLGGLFAVLWIGALVAAFALGDRLPVLPELQRRLLVTPLILLATAWFGDFAADLFDGLDLGTIAGALFGQTGTGGEAAIAVFLLMGLVGGSAAFYAGLIVAPRELASPEPRPAVWLLRYVVFLVTAVVGGAGIVLL